VIERGARRDAELVADLPNRRRDAVLLGEAPDETRDVLLSSRELAHLRPPIMT
jgi:hypothetical protein